MVLPSLPTCLPVPQLSTVEPMHVLSILNQRSKLRSLLSEAGSSCLRHEGGQLIHGLYRLLQFLPTYVLPYQVLFRWCGIVLPSSYSICTTSSAGCVTESYLLPVVWQMRAIIIISSTWVTPNSTLLLSRCYTYGGLHCTKHPTR